MKQQVIEDVNIMPQLDKACGLDQSARRLSSTAKAEQA
jgi:hypothetical protein